VFIAYLLISNSGDDDSDADEFYCRNHCNQHGYCSSCGIFWRGEETFDLSERFCENCRSQEEFNDDNSEPISDEVDESGYRRCRL